MEAVLVSRVRVVMKDREDIFRVFSRLRSPTVLERKELEHQQPRQWRDCELYFLWKKYEFCTVTYFSKSQYSTYHFAMRRPIDATTVAFDAAKWD